MTTGLLYSGARDRALASEPGVDPVLMAGPEPQILMERVLSLALSRNPAQASELRPSSRTSHQ